MAFQSVNVKLQNEERRKLEADRKSAKRKAEKGKEPGKMKTDCSLLLAEKDFCGDFTW